MCSRFSSVSSSSSFISVVVRPSPSSLCAILFCTVWPSQPSRLSPRLTSPRRTTPLLDLPKHVTLKLITIIIVFSNCVNLCFNFIFCLCLNLVVGETAVIGNIVSILHYVTLDSTGKIGGDRHPKISDGVLIGVGATIFGNVRIGEGAKIGARSVVLIDVPPQTTAVGNSWSLVGGKEKHSKHEDVSSESMDHTSFISEWSVYII
ncbi:hypothetical protein S83_052339 [Arachis hypogaea]